MPSAGLQIEDPGELDHGSRESGGLAAIRDAVPAPDIG
jgi:hypothetical protein